MECQILRLDVCCCLLALLATTIGCVDVRDPLPDEIPVTKDAGTVNAGEVKPLGLVQVDFLVAVVGSKILLVERDGARKSALQPRGILLGELDHDKEDIYRDLILDQKRSGEDLYVLRSSLLRPLRDVQFSTSGGSPGLAGNLWRGDPEEGGNLWLKDTAFTKVQTVETTSMTPSNCASLNLCYVLICDGPEMISAPLFESTLNVDSVVKLRLVELRGAPSQRRQLYKEAFLVVMKKPAEEWEASRPIAGKIQIEGTFYEAKFQIVTTYK